MYVFPLLSAPDTLANGCSEFCRESVLQCAVVVLSEAVLENSEVFNLCGVHVGYLFVLA